MNIVIIIPILLGLLLVWLGVTSIISCVRARKIGIVRVIFPANLVIAVIMAVCAAAAVFLSAESAATSRKYSAYIADMETRGIEAVAEYENKPVYSYFEFIAPETRDAYTIHIVSIERSRYEKQAALTLRQSRVYAVAAVLLALYLPSLIVFVTKDGLMYAGSVKPHKFSVVAREKRLCFYIDNNSHSEKPFMKRRGSEKNRARFSEYIAASESLAEKDIV